MKKKLLVNLIHDLEQEMLKLGYSSGSMKFYRERWQMILQFAEQHSERFYSERLGLDFLKKHFHILEKNLHRPLSQSETQELRVIRMIGDFQLHHTIARRYYGRQKVFRDPYFTKIRDQFRNDCVKKEYSNITVEHYVSQSEHFMDYLVSQHVKDCKSINLILIHNYIKTLAGYTYKTVEQNICSLRSFFRFLLETKKVKTHFSSKMPMVQARKQTRIPSVWTKDELKKLISAIDRGSPKGKRDYAIILLACCLGMRCTDIKNLKMENFHWEQKELIFIQSKTKNPIALPLIKEVGWAVIDYLKHGRPKVDSPYLFLRHLAPFSSFSEGDHLAQLIKNYMQLAHMPTLRKKRGMHSLRHTMASMLLEADTPLATISDILGHIDTDSTAVYLKVDIKKLKECALDFKDLTDHA